MVRGVGGVGGFGGLGGGGGQWPFYGQGGPDPWPPVGRDGRRREQRGRERSDSDVAERMLRPRGVPMEGLLQGRRTLERNIARSHGPIAGIKMPNGRPGRVPGGSGGPGAGPGVAGGSGAAGGAAGGVGGLPVGSRMNQLQGAGGFFAGGRRARMAAQLAALGTQQQGAEGAKGEGKEDK
jgi:hypothetical protein